MTAVSPVRVAVMALGIGLIVGGRFVGGFAGAVVIGVGIGFVVLALGSRRPHLLRRRDADPDGDSDGERDRRW